MIIALTTIVCLLALIPACMVHRNLKAYAPPPLTSKHSKEELHSISVLIPARNEERTIRAAVEAALSSENVIVEVIVLDDHSDDATAAIVAMLAKQDTRLRLLSAPPLPPGWCGKQHACAVLAQQAQYPVLTFIDADVRLAPEGLARMANFLRRSGADLVSGIPYQETGTLVEKMMIPVIHFLLLAFLPFKRMRNSCHPVYGTGCGQLFMTHRAAYEKAGGHAAIRASLHDGLTLPRAYRAAHLTTDLCDATDVATCRMYHGALEVWHGLGKNATEGLASARLIIPATLMLLGGQIVPFWLFGIGLMGAISGLPLGLAVVGVGATLYVRLSARGRFRQPIVSVLLHPVAILLLLMIQWQAWGRALRGTPSVWKGRQYGEAHIS